MPAPLLQAVFLRVTARGAGFAHCSAVLPQRCGLSIGLPRLPTARTCALGEQAARAIHAGTPSSAASAAKKRSKATVAKTLLGRLRGSKSKPRVLSSAERKRNIARGKQLEERVARILTAEGRGKVTTNVILRDHFGNRSEIDVVCGRIFKTYIECKNYSRRTIPLEDVAKFKSVLELNGIPMSRGMLVSTGEFTPRARTIGIRCVNGKELDKWEARALHTARKRRLRLVAALGAGGVFMAVHQAPFFVEALGLEGGGAGETLLALHKGLSSAIETASSWV